MDIYVEGERAKRPSITTSAGMLWQWCGILEVLIMSVGRQSLGKSKIEFLALLRFGARGNDRGGGVRGGWRSCWIRHGVLRVHGHDGS